MYDIQKYQGPFLPQKSKRRKRPQFEEIPFLPYTFQGSNKINIIKVII